MKNTNAFTMIATKTDTFIQKKPQNGFKLLTNNCKTTLKHITKNENNKLVHKKHAGHFQMLSSATVQRKQSKSSFSMLYCHKNKSMLQPMFLNDFANEFLNPQFEDEPVQDNSQQFKEQIRSMTFQDTYDTDGVVTDEFVQNHVVEDDLLNKSEIVAKSRQKPVSTTILFTSADKRNLVREIRTRNLNGYFSTQMSQRNNVVTSNDKYLFVEWVKKGSKYKLGRVGFGKIRYGFRSTRIIGGTMYFLTHLDRMVDVETTV